MSSNAGGRTAGGTRYALVNYFSNFNPAQDNNAESVFSYQASVNDGSGTNGSILTRMAALYWNGRTEGKKAFAVVFATQILPTGDVTHEKMYDALERELCAQLKARL